MTTWLSTPTEMQFRVIDGLSVRFAQSADADRGAQDLLLNPWPECLLAFEPVWARLAEHACLVAVELPGMTVHPTDAADRDVPTQENQQ
jgi:hypothetical protein